MTKTSHYSKDQLASHVQRICDDNLISTEYEPTTPRIFPETRTVRIRPVKTVATYAQAMFTIGHLLGKWQSRPRLERLTGAWIWASTHSLPGIVEDERFRQQREISMQRNHRWVELRWENARESARTNFKGLPKHPDIGHDYWKILFDEFD